MSDHRQRRSSADESSSVTPTESEPSPPHSPISTADPYLHLSVTRTWGNRTLPVNSEEWRNILTRDNRTCASCAYTSPFPNGRGLQINHRNGDASDNDLTNLRIHCPPCEAIWHCGLSAIKGWVQLAKSDMVQVEIVRRTRQIFEELGRVPRIRDVDPSATGTKITIIDLANKLMQSSREDLTEEEKGLRGFFTQKASDRFAITMATEESSSSTQPQPSNPSDAQALKILDIEESLPWVRFSPVSDSTLQNFLATWPPSSTSQDRAAWICVDDPRPQAANGKPPTGMSDLCQSWDAICTDRKPTIADLDELARRFDVLGGKWLVFSQPDRVDALWSWIAKATHQGKLGISAKVSPRNDSDSHVICVFTEDYMDEADVAKVRKGLRRLGVMWRISYKPDIYTVCRIYQGNLWKIKPSRYRD